MSSHCSCQTNTTNELIKLLAGRDNSAFTAQWSAADTVCCVLSTNQFNATLTGRPQLFRNIATGRQCELVNYLCSMVIVANGALQSTASIFMGFWLDALVALFWPLWPLSFILYHSCSMRLFALDSIMNN